MANSLIYNGFIYGISIASTELNKDARHHSEEKDMDEAKIYNVCLQRVKFQIGNAKLKPHGGLSGKGKMVLESYNTGDIEEIIDILEIYDIDARDRNALQEKLDDLAYTVSLLVGDEVSFDYDEKGNLGLYLTVNKRLGEEYNAADAVLAAAVR